MIVLKEQRRLAAFYHHPTNDTGATITLVNLVLSLQMVRRRLKSTSSLMLFHYRGPIQKLTISCLAEIALGKIILVASTTAVIVLLLSPFLSKLLNSKQGFLLLSLRQLLHLLSLLHPNHFLPFPLLFLLLL